MAAAKLVFGVIASTEQSLERRARRGRNEMILACENSQHRHVDPLEIDVAAVELESTLGQAILFDEPLHELAKHFARLIGAVEDPFLHAQKILERLRVFDMIHEIDVLLTRQSKRH